MTRLALALASGSMLAVTTWAGTAPDALIVASNPRGYHEGAQTSPTPLSPEQRFSAIGSASCRACHRAIYEAWSASPHGVATAALDLDERVDTACKPCHAPLFDPDHPVMSSEDAVGCEACHGPGSVYSILAVMIDPLKREGAGIREGRQACPECHNPEHADHIERDFANEMRRVHQAPAIRQVQH